MKGESFLAVMMLMAAVAAPAATARVWHVPAEAPTIQAGIDLAAAGDIVEVACGTYLEHDILMKAGVILRSETGEPDCVRIDAQQQGRVILCQDLDPAAGIVGLTLTGGRMPGPSDFGGGMLCRNSLVTVSHCDFVGNYSGYEGGGLACHSCAPEVSHCRFIGNEGYMSGGGVLCRLSEAVLSHCSFESNRAVDGAGLSCQYSSPTVEWCTFLDNDGLFWGGAIFCHAYSSPAISNCSLVGNEAHVGGGITTIYYSYPTMENSIIAFSREGEGVHCYDDFGDSTYLYLTCCNVFGNAGGSYTGWIQDQTGLNGNIAADPLFCGLDEGNLMLAGESPCLPAGNDCGVLMGALGEGCTITPVLDGPPAVFDLAANHPNPFNPLTRIAFTLPEALPTELTVYSLRGGRVATLVRERMPAGPHSIVWDGRDDRGRLVPSGVYLYRLEAASFMATRGMTLVR